MVQPLTTTFHDRLPDLVVFDLETTGYFFGEHEIHELGAVRVSPDLRTIRGEFDRRVRPEHPERITPEILAREHVTLEMLQQGDLLPTVLKDFASFAAGSVLAGYNVAFDWGFLKHAYRTHDLDLDVDYHVFDVMSLVLADVLRRGRPQSIRLRDALLRLGLPPQPEPHRALTDARLTLEVLRAVVHPPAP